MKLTIKEALQQGIAAHKDGKHEEAERLYRAIMQSQPTHPDANHNLGVLAVSVNKADAALPLFKTALEANPKIEQFWLSYIEALIKEKQFDNAKQVLERAKKQGLYTDRLNSLEIQISSKTQKTSTGRSNPPKELIDNLLEYFQNGQFIDAEKLAIQFTQDFPNYQFGWKVLGAVLKQDGKISESLVPSQKSVQLAPQDPEAHSNLGLTLKELGKLDKAEESFKQAIMLKPDYAEAHNHLGNLFQEFGRLEEAETSYNHAIDYKPDFAEAYNNLGIIFQKLGKLDKAEKTFLQAIALKPNLAKAHNNLGVTLQELGRFSEAVGSYAKTIALNPDYASAYINLSIAIKNKRFTSSNLTLYPLLLQLLTNGNFTRPIEVAPSILSLLKYDPLIKNLLLKKNFDMSLKEVTSIITSLDKVKLLHQLMRLCPLPELHFERLFVAMRSFLLKNMDKMEESPELIYFLSTLSIHCFINEYIYPESNEEISLIEELQSKISQIVTQSKQPEAIKILCLASYRPLHQYNWCQKLEALDNLEEVKKRLIEEPILEKIIARDITVLEEISDYVSLKVKEQYEENPYPRWVKHEASLKAKPIALVCDELELQLYSENIKNTTDPFILIAGCGTGQHSIGTASRFSNCHVTAVDLSLSSLAYAQRKSNELGFTNIDYLQADILHLHQIGKEFDIIESSGVLHHMDEPIVGWRVLKDILKPGGLMRIGLYSNLARKHIVDIREEIELLKVGKSEHDIRNFRRLLTESNEVSHQLLTKSNDFFSLSELRDLIFHVQEHRFTLPQIKNCLEELDLKFCGFENRNAISNFREFYGKEADIYDLTLWDQFEKSQPLTFASMYGFWCQKL